MSTFTDEKDRTEFLWVLSLLRFFLILFGIIFLMIYGLFSINEGLRERSDVPYDIILALGLILIVCGILAITYSKRINFYWNEKQIVILTKIFFNIPISHKTIHFNDVKRFEVYHISFPTERMSDGDIRLKEYAYEYYIVFVYENRLLLDFIWHRTPSLGEPKSLQKRNERFAELAERLNKPIVHLEEIEMRGARRTAKEIQLRLFH